MNKMINRRRRMAALVLAVVLALGMILPSGVVATYADSGELLEMEVKDSKIHTAIKHQSSVNVQTPVIENQPEGSSVKTGEKVSLSVKASVTDDGTLSYQWHRNDKNSNKGGTKIAGATAATYSFDTASAGTAYYYVVITNTNDGKTVTIASAPAMVEVAAVTYTITADTGENGSIMPAETIINAQTPVIENQPEGRSVKVGEEGLLSVKASVMDGGILTYQWYSNDKESNSGGMKITGATEAAYSPDTASAGTAYYYVVVTNTNDSATNNKAAEIASEPARVEVTAVTYSITATAGENGSITPSGIITVEEGGSQTFTITPAEGYEIDDVQVNGTSVGAVSSCEVENVTSDSTIHAAFKRQSPAIVNAQTPVIQNHPGNSSVKTGEKITLSVTAAVTDGGTLTYQWYSNDKNSNSGGTEIAGATEASYSPATASAGTKYYYVVVTNNNNSVTGSKTAVIVSNPATVTVSAAGSPNTYNVTYHANGGSGTVPAPASVTGGDEYTIVQPANLNAPSGQQFAGWNTNSSGSGTSYAPGTSITVKSDLNLYAIWEDIPTTTYTITFHPNGGRVSPSAMQTDTNGKLASLPTPTRTGYSFAGWYTAAKDGTKIGTDHIFKADTTLYAQWKYTAKSTSTTKNSGKSSTLKNTPKTGDFGSSPGWWLLAMIPAAALACYAAAQLRQKRRSNK